MRVAILGCGYVGLELGRQLADEHEIYGVRRSDEGLDAIRTAGFEPIRADLTRPATFDRIPDVDAAVFAASSGGRDAEAASEIYVDAQRQVLEALGERDSPPDRYVYTSSTGVYGDHDGGWVTEETPIAPSTDKTRVLATAESVALDESAAIGADGTVVRFAGLYGPDRYRLERYVDGPVTEGYLNAIHRSDAAGVVAFVLENDVDEDVLLAVDGEPVDKWDFADWLADRCDRPAPPKRTVEDLLADGDVSERVERRLRTSKRCSNERLRTLGYDYRYPTHHEGYGPAIRDYRSGRDAE